MEAASAVSASPSGSARPSQKTPSVQPMPSRPAIRKSGSNPPSSAASRVAPVARAQNGKMDMDWDDEEATHVFRDEDRVSKREKPKSESPQVAAAAAEGAPSADESGQHLQGPNDPHEPERASMDQILAEPARESQMPATAPLGAMPTPPLAALPQPAPVAPPPALAAPSPLEALSGRSAPPPAEPPASLSGAFGALGKPSSASTPPSARFRSAPPTSQAIRSAPPPRPPASLRNASQPPPPRPPPPPGQPTTAPMHMPERVPFGLAAPPHAKTLESAKPAAIPPPPSHAPSTPFAYQSNPPSSNPSHHPSAHPSAMPSAPPVPNLPPVGRAMEQTMLTRSSSSKTPLVFGLLIGVAAIAAAAVFFLMPRTGTLVVNVADAKGGAVNNLEVSVDGTKRCDSAPCIVRDISAGVHEVKVVAKGFDSPAPRAVTVDGRRDAPTDFQLVPAKASAGTGFKVSAPQPGLKLQVDGKDIGPLPQDIRDLEPGEHKLHITGDRYQPLDKTISVGKDEIIDLGNVNLKVVKGKATIQLATPGAKVVLVNGTTRKEVPQFPMAIEFDPSEKWELTATKDGFDEFKERIAFEDGQAEKTFNITLAPKGSGATAAASPTTATPTTLAATPGALRDPSTTVPKTAPKEVKPTSGGDTSAATGETALKINSLPASSIVLDGKPIGVTPQTHVPVSPGTHTVMFVNAEQSLKKTISVDVKAGETKAAFAKLRDE
jgi:hypothetical protein